MPPDKRLRLAARVVSIAPLLILMSACANPTGPGSITSFQSIIAHRALWRAQNLTDYSYTYQFWAFNRLAGQPLQLEIRDDTVRSVVVVATGVHRSLRLDRCSERREL
jgi:hypothetical protein